MSLGLPIRVFVYGTLKRGEPNANIITNTPGQYRFISEGRTKLQYPLIVATKYNIPFVLNEPGKGYKIEGEVYEIDDIKLSILDRLEAYPSLYWRQKEKITLPNGDETVAWMYLLRKWRSDIYELATPMMSSYSSKGAHGRAYVPRWVNLHD
ncbi:AIG2-like family protein [Dictyocaulus viviparus]|uniref:Gamma-glutamylcyclotransferase family protein n=1 Tax=Dictyocaulus viviparus TaxID=29172 RepID=A0A0D8XKS0_DICVI|nr:AIG2-like family protein [Dictyocaulus viviparus]